MGKSMVLKDEKNRPCGYLMASGGEWICCAKQETPSQAVLFFEDGTQQSFELTGAAEQRLPCGQKGIAGCCVVCASTVLVSDDAARCAYERNLMRSKKQPKQEDIRKSETEAQTTEEKRAETGQDEYIPGSELAQRRWPPPPCWERARYQRGRWQETETI